jgi:hypothetical protein
MAEQEAIRVKQLKSTVRQLKEEKAVITKKLESI